jgi:hypothetical protein
MALAAVNAVRTADRKQAGSTPARSDGDRPQGEARSTE